EVLHREGHTQLAHLTPDGPRHLGWRCAELARLVAVARVLAGEQGAWARHARLEQGVVADVVAGEGCLVYRWPNVTDSAPPFGCVSGRIRVGGIDLGIDLLVRGGPYLTRFVAATRGGAADQGKEARHADLG